MHPSGHLSLQLGSKKRNPSLAWKMLSLTYLLGVLLWRQSVQKTQAGQGRGLAYFYHFEFYFSGRSCEGGAISHHTPGGGQGRLTEIVSTGLGLYSKPLTSPPTPPFLTSYSCLSWWLSYFLRRIIRQDHQENGKGLLTNSLAEVREMVCVGGVYLQSLEQ